MRYTNSRSPVQCNYNLDGILLETVNQFKDLGVIFDSILKFQNHIEYVKNKYLATLGFMYRIGKEFTNITALKTLYFSLVIPILLYASPIWSPFYAVHTKKIETVQYKFLNIISWKFGLPLTRLSHDYSTVSQLSNISSLKSHR